MYNTQPFRISNISLFPLCSSLESNNNGCLITFHYTHSFTLSTVPLLYIYYHSVGLRVFFFFSFLYFLFSFSPLRRFLKWHTKTILDLKQQPKRYNFSPCRLLLCVCFFFFFFVFFIHRYIWIVYDTNNFIHTNISLHFVCPSLHFHSMVYFMLLITVLLQCDMNAGPMHVLYTTYNYKRTMGHHRHILEFL